MDKFGIFEFTCIATNTLVRKLHEHLFRPQRAYRCLQPFTDNLMLARAAVDVDGPKYCLFWQIHLRTF